MQRISSQQEEHIEGPVNRNGQYLVCLVAALAITISNLSPKPSPPSTFPGDVGGTYHPQIVIEERRNNWLLSLTCAGVSH